MCATSSAPTETTSESSARGATRTRSRQHDVLCREPALPRELREAFDETDSCERRWSRADRPDQERLVVPQLDFVGVRIPDRVSKRKELSTVGIERPRASTATRRHSEVEVDPFPNPDRTRHACIWRISGSFVISFLASRALNCLTSWRLNSFGVSNSGQRARNSFWTRYACRSLSFQ